MNQTISTPIHRRFPRLLATAIAACGALSGAEPPAGRSPLFVEAIRQFETMKVTQYQHRTRVDQVAGSYRYDCVGFVSYALKQATPVAWATAFKSTGIAKGRIPSPPRYRAFFADLAANPKPGWEAVGKASDLRPGDIVSWEHKTKTSSGHAVVIGGMPKARADGSWEIDVYDSTSSPHGETDSRRTDKRAEILESSGRPSGLGRGVMIFVADKESGALVGLRWSVKSKTLITPIAAGRPIS